MNTNFCFNTTVNEYICVTKIFFCTVWEDLHIFVLAYYVKTVKTTTNKAKFNQTHTLYFTFLFPLSPPPPLSQSAVEGCFSTIPNHYPPSSLWSSQFLAVKVLNVPVSALYYVPQSVPYASLMSLLDPPPCSLGSVLLQQSLTPA